MPSRLVAHGGLIMKLRVSLIFSAFFLSSGCAQMPSQQPGEAPQLVLAAAGKSLKTEPLACQGTGSPDCEKNWLALQVGHTASDTTYWVGSGEQTTRQIFIDRVERTTRFSSGGSLIFNNDKLVSIVFPQTYMFPILAPVAADTI